MSSIGQVMKLGRFRFVKLSRRETHGAFAYEETIPLPTPAIPYCRIVGSSPSCLSCILVRDR